MRDLILSAAVTLDGFMAGPANDLDFMVIDDDLDRTMMTEELAARADTIVVGRKSFHDMAGYWTTATGALARWMNDTPKVVLSNTLEDASSVWPNSPPTSGSTSSASATTWWTSKPCPTRCTPTCPSWPTDPARQGTNVTRSGSIRGVCRLLAHRG